MEKKTAYGKGEDCVDKLDYSEEKNTKSSIEFSQNPADEMLS